MKSASYGNINVFQQDNLHNMSTMLTLFPWLYMMDMSDCQSVNSISVKYYDFSIFTFKACFKAFKSYILHWRIWFHTKISENWDIRDFLNIWENGILPFIGRNTLTSWIIGVCDMMFSHVFYKDRFVYDLFVPMKTKQRKWLLCWQRSMFKFVWMYFYLMAYISHARKLQ